jgi:hypothetical protein
LNAGKVQVRRESGQGGKGFRLLRSGIRLSRESAKASLSAKQANAEA